MKKEKMIVGHDSKIKYSGLWISPVQREIQAEITSEIDEQNG